MYFTGGTNENNSDIIYWTIDSGVSNHMINSKKMRLYDTKEHIEEISFANGNTIESIHIGTYKGYINHNLIILNETFYTFHSLKKKLIIKR